MLKKVITLSLVFSACTLLHAQKMEDIFDRKANITWLGLDFTGAKFIGDRERFGTLSDVKELMVSWNDLMLKEPDKYDIALAIDKVRVTEDFSITYDNNAALDMSDAFSNSDGDYFHFRPNDIIRIVAGYDFKGKSGIGVMLNVESFNKLKAEAAVWVTFIDMEKKDVFFSERVTGDASGFGLRNYWGNSIYDMFKSMRKKEFEMWRKKYYRKF